MGYLFVGMDKHVEKHRKKIYVQMLGTAPHETEMTTLTTATRPMDTMDLWARPDPDVMDMDHGSLIWLSFWSIVDLGQGRHSRG